LVGILPFGFVAIRYFHCCVTVSSCVSGDLLSVLQSRSSHGHVSGYCSFKDVYYKLVMPDYALSISGGGAPLSVLLTYYVGGDKIENEMGGHVARMGEGRGVYMIFVEKPEGKSPLGRPRRRW
jgi:hypothetical protein